MVVEDGTGRAGDEDEGAPLVGGPGGGDGAGGAPPPLPTLGATISSNLRRHNDETMQKAGVAGVVAFACVLFCTFFAGIIWVVVASGKASYGPKDTDIDVWAWRATWNPHVSKSKHRPMTWPEDKEARGIYASNFWHWSKGGAAIGVLCAPIAVFLVFFCGALCFASMSAIMAHRGRQHAAAQEREGRREV